MARLRLTLHNISCFDNESLAAKTSDLSVSTEKETATTTFQIDDNKYKYILNLVDFSFKKKMYQPTEVTADIQLTMASNEIKAIKSRYWWICSVKRRCHWWSGRH